MLAPYALRKQLEEIQRKIEGLFAKKRATIRDGLTEADCKNLVEEAKKIRDPLEGYALDLIPPVRYLAIGVSSGVRLHVFLHIVFVEEVADYWSPCCGLFGMETSSAVVRKRSCKTCSTCKNKRKSGQPIGLDFFARLKQKDALKSRQAAKGSTVCLTSLLICYALIIMTVIIII